MGGLGKAVGSVFSSVFGGGGGLEMGPPATVEQTSSVPAGADGSVKAAAEEERRRRRAAGGITLLTGDLAGLAAALERGLNNPPLAWPVPDIPGAAPGAGGG